MDWPHATIVIVTIVSMWVGVCFLRWLRFQRDMEANILLFKDRAFTLEEKKFDVWKTSQLAHTAQQGQHARTVVQRAMRDFPGVSAADMEPSAGNVIPFAPRSAGKYAMVSEGDGEPEMTEERLAEIAELLVRAKDMPEEEAKAFLAEHGLHDVAIFRNDSE